MSDIGIADLKARLSEHLRSVRNGATVTVLDRGTPIARIVTYVAQPLGIRKARRRLRDVKLPRKPGKRTDSLAVLIEDRRSRRLRISIRRRSCASSCASQGPSTTCEPTTGSCRAS